MGEPRKRRIRHIVFDLNGTLADTKRAFLTTRSRHIDRLTLITGVGRDVLLSEMRAFLGTNSLHPDIAAHLPSIVRWQREIAAEPCSTERRERLDFEVAEFKRHIVQSYQLKIATKRVLTLLRHRGITLSVWSGSRAPYVVDVMILLGLDELIDHVFCPLQLHGVHTSLDNQKLRFARMTTLTENSKKPCVRTLRTLVEKIGISQQETILVSNSLVSDGISTIGTDVEFILLNTLALTTDEIKLADSMTGTESKRKVEAEAKYRLQAKKVHPMFEISKLNELMRLI